MDKNVETNPRVFGVKCFQVIYQLGNERLGFVLDIASLKLATPVNLILTIISMKNTMPENWFKGARRSTLTDAGQSHISRGIAELDGNCRLSSK